jgi:predicted AAA+ superfamily ATPase
MRRGWYPPVIDRQLDPDLWYENYIATYLERDVRLIDNIRDLPAFRRFLYLCAGRTGQLVNLSELAGECGVSHNTIKAWVSILEASYLVRLVQPYHRNYNKRVVKTPKLYFLDTGLAARLLGIRTDDQLAQHPLRGALFETMIHGELAKRRHNMQAPWNIYFWRDHGGSEVDFILEDGTELTAVEVKSGATFHPDSIAALSRFSVTAGKDLKHSVLVYGGTESFDFKHVAIVPWNALWSSLGAAGGNWIPGLQPPP